MRPLRRTDLLSQRIEGFEQRTEATRQRWLPQQEAVQKAHDRLAEARQQVPQRQAILAELEEDYRVRQRQERPTSRLALARKRLKAAQGRYPVDHETGSEARAWAERGCAFEMSNREPVIT